MTWAAKPVDPEETFFLDVNILREDGLAVGLAVQNGNISPDEALQNARMMATGPEAIAILKEWLIVGNDLGARRVVRAKASAAIAKAEGRS